MKKIITILSCTMIAGLVQASMITLDATSLQTVFGTTDKVETALTAGSQAWAVGETVILKWDMAISGGIDPTYSASANWSFGFRDSTASYGAVTSLRVGATPPLWSSSLDSSASGAGSTTADLGSSYRKSATGVAAGAYDLKQSGDAAQFEMSVKRTSATSYDFTTSWKDTAGGLLQQDTWTDDNGVQMDSFDNVLFATRLSSTDVVGTMSDITLEVIPEPATLGLISAAGIGLIGLRRFFMV